MSRFDMRDIGDYFFNIPDKNTIRPLTQIGIDISGVVFIPAD